MGVPGRSGMIDPNQMRIQLKSYINPNIIKFQYDHMVAMTGWFQNLKINHQIKLKFLLNLRADIIWDVGTNAKIIGEF